MLYHDCSHLPLCAYNVVNPSGQLGDVGVDARLVLLPAAVAPAHDARENPASGAWILHH
jgi:hypothetical protein